MKNYVSLAIIALCVMMASCSKKVNEQVTEKTDGEGATAVATLELAYGLAHYGEENQSPLALVQAADMLATVPTQAYEGERPLVEGEVAEKAEKAELTIEKLLGDAKAYAADELTKSFVEKEEARILAVAEATRGARGGAIYDTDRCPANSTVTYRDVVFVGGALAEVYVVGDGDTDLDLYVYDENGNLIDKDIDNTDMCYCSWCPSWTGSFRIVVKNLGRVYNQYRMWTN